MITEMAGHNKLLMYLRNITLHNVSHYKSLYGNVLQLKFWGITL